MTPRRAPWGLWKSASAINSHPQPLVPKNRLTRQPRRDSLQTVQDGPIVAGSHLTTQTTRHHGEVETAEVGFLVPWCLVEVEESLDLRLLGDFGHVGLLSNHLEAGGLEVRDEGGRVRRRRSVLVESSPAQLKDYMRSPMGDLIWLQCGE